MVVEGVNPFFAVIVVKLLMMDAFVLSIFVVRVEYLKIDPNLSRLFVFYV